MESVYILSGDKGLCEASPGRTMRRLVRRECDSEVESGLWDLVVEHPEILAGDQIDPERPRQWVSFRARSFRVSCS